MSWFNYHMPPFTNVMGALYILVGVVYIFHLIKSGYWAGVFSQIIKICRKYYYLIIGIIILDLMVIQFIDVPFTLLMQHLEPLTHTYTFWDFICSCAEGGFIVGVLFTLLLLAKQFKQQSFAAVTKVSLMASIYAGLANGILKFLFNRQRPAIGLAPWNFFEFFHSGARHLDDLMYAYNSMPSGHTVTTVAALVPFFLVYRHKLWRGGLILWCLMVAFARVYTINHWLSDVVIASLFGLIIGYAVYCVNLSRLYVKN